MMLMIIQESTCTFIKYMPRQHTEIFIFFSTDSTTVANLYFVVIVWSVRSVKDNQFAHENCQSVCLFHAMKASVL